MKNRFDQRIDEVTRKFAKREKLQREIHSLNEILSSENAKILGLEKLLTKEHRDLKRMESFSLTSLFYSILGNKEEKTEKERREYLSAKLNYDQAVQVRDLLQGKVDGIAVELKKLKYVEDEYKYVMGLKESYIISSNQPDSKELMEITEDLSRLDTRTKELKEAKEVADKLEKKLQGIFNILKSAQNWGSADMIVGGPGITSVKHSKINAAKGMMVRTQYLIDRLISELKDVDLGGQLDESLQIDEFLSFSDYFFDGLIVDYMVQKKIVNSKVRVAQTRIKVLHIIRKLDWDLERNQNRKTRLEQRKDNLIQKS